MNSYRLNRFRGTGAIVFSSMSAIKIVTAVHVMMSISMHAPLVYAAAANNHASSAAFCPLYSTHKSIANKSCYGERRGGILYASVAPKPPRGTNAGAKKHETSLDTSHNLHLEGELPNLSDGSHHHSDHLGISATTSPVAISLDQNGTVLIQQKTEQPIKHQPNDRAAIAGITLFLSLAVGAVLKWSPPGCWRYYLAGGICASTSHAITTPIDVVKVSSETSNAV